MDRQQKQNNKPAKAGINNDHALYWHAKTRAANDVLSDPNH